MPTQLPHPALAQLDVEFNLPRQLTTEEIDQARRSTLLEVYRIVSPNLLWQYQDDDAQESPSAEPIVEEHEETQMRRLLLERQLRVSLRHIDQQLELDTEICGNKDLGTLGVRLPVLNVRHHGKHHITIITRNAWGSTDYRDPAMQRTLRERFTTTDAAGETHVDEEAYERTLASFLEDRVDASADMPVLNEEDYVDIFDQQGNFVGRAVVSDVAGNEVRLHLRSGVRLRTGFTMRKKSNRTALMEYKRCVQRTCGKLDCEETLKDRAGAAYQWGELAEEDDAPYRDPYGSMYTYDRLVQRLSLVEEAFFGTNPDEVERRTRNQAYDRSFSPQYIPRTIVDDPEQCAAFGLGAAGHPCYLIQGPPGTGKTTVASHLTRHLQQQGLKTLILSHSNRGLDVLLLAARKCGARVHRGGTEMGVCDRELHDTFIRRGLAHPHRSDFLVSSFDEEDFSAAQARHAQDPTVAAPRREDYVSYTLDSKAWKEAWREFDAQKRMILEELQQESGLVAGVTLNSLISDEIIQELDFDVVIVDEATKGHLYEFLPALAKAGKQIIFIGDHKQLGNMDLPPHLKRFLEDNGARDPLTAPRRDRWWEGIGPQDVAAYERGLFTLLAEQTDIPQVMLRTNRRSLPAIVELVSKTAYDGKLKAGRIDHTNPENIGELVWVDTSTRPDRIEQRSGTSKVNPLEARLVARRLHRDFRKGHIGGESSFGVITMYRPQGKKIREQARKIPIADPAERDAYLKCLAGNISTVDAFQGSQRAHIYMATTRSNDQEAIGFLDRVERGNVGCSRAEDSLVIYGDKATLIDNNPDPESRAFYAIAYECCKTHGRVVDAFSDVPVNVKPEEQKSQTHNAKRQRARRTWKRAAQATQDVE